MFVRRTALATVGAAAAVVLLATPALALPAFGTAPVHGTGGGAHGVSPNVVTGVTVGHHPDYDRVVFTLSDGVPPFDVSYVSQVRHDPSDRVVTLQGSAFLRVVLHGTSGMAASAQPTITPGFTMLKQVKGAGDFEAVTSYGLGAASRSGFRAFVLTGPSRLVVDLAIPGGGSTAGAAGSGSGSAGSAGSGSSAGGSSSSGGSLAQTGTHDTIPLAVGALALVGLGGAGLYLTRRQPVPAA